MNCLLDLSQRRRGRQPNRARFARSHVEKVVRKRRLVLAQREPGPERRRLRIDGDIILAVADLRDCQRKGRRSQFEMLGAGEQDQIFRNGFAIHIERQPE